MSGPESLLFADIIRYAQLSGYTSADEILFFSGIMRACDEVFMSHVAKLREREKSSKPAKQKR